jgi:hypothetical protein
MQRLAAHLELHRSVGQKHRNREAGHGSVADDGLGHRADHRIGASYRDALGRQALETELI